MGAPGAGAADRGPQGRQGCSEGTAQRGGEKEVVQGPENVAARAARLEQARGRPWGCPWSAGGPEPRAAPG